MSNRYVPKAGDLVSPTFGSWPLGIVLSEPYYDRKYTEKVEIDTGTVDVAWFYGESQRITQNFCVNLVLILRPEEEK